MVSALHSKPFIIFLKNIIKLHEECKNHNSALFYFSNRFSFQNYTNVNYHQVQESEVKR